MESATLSEYSFISETTAEEATVFRRWRPTHLMEWAKSGHALGVYNLSRSGIPLIPDLKLLPGGPFKPDFCGHNEWGHEGLKAVIGEMYDAEPGGVLLAQGASQCNFLMAGAILSAGGTAIVETPVYEPVMRGIEVWADRVDFLPRRKENGFLPDPDELRHLIDGKTRLIWLTNLQNPTHSYLSTEAMAAIVEIASDAGAMVVVDEVFHTMLDRDHRHHAHSVGAISINSLGKSWGLDSLRVGWAVGPTELVYRAYRLNNLLGVNQPYSTEDLACRILSEPAAVDYIAAWAKTAAKGRALFEHFLERTPQVSCMMPPAGICAVVELPAGIDDIEFCRKLLERKATTVFPASLFKYPGAVRVAFGGPRDDTAEGLKRLREMILEWQ